MNTEIDQDFDGRYEFYHYQQLLAQHEEWLDSQDCINYVNGLIQEILNDERESNVPNIT